MNKLHAHTFKYSDAADFAHQLESMRRKLLSSVQQEEMLNVRERYKLNPAQFSMRIKRFKGDLTATRIGGRIVSLFVTRELHDWLSK